MCRIGQLYRRMQRLVHDLLRQTGKPADLELVGEETEVDKMLVDQLGDPLMHLIRNAIDHCTVWSFIFRAGFSTAEQVSNLSGRGVGMDVVRNTVQAPRGRIQIDTHPGQGACVTMIIPLTLAFLEGQGVRARGRLYALPIDVVDEVFKPDPTRLINSSAGGSELVDWQDRLVPVSRLQRIYAETEDDRPLADQIVVVVRTREG